MQRSSSDRDFAGYNAAQSGRPVRPLARDAIAAARDGSAVDLTVTGSSRVERRSDRRATASGRPTHGARTPLAIDLGCGRGIESRYLAESGYTVHAYDVDRSVTAEMAELAAEHPVHHITADLAEVTELPSADLVLACASLPFVPRTEFDVLWEAVRRALRRGGVLAVDLFGHRDDWASTDGTYLTRPEAEALFDGLDLLSMSEVERDGASFAGPKHWHTYQVLARRPGVVPVPQDGLIA